ncbi:MAG: hypothetical protein Sylvanvirus26_7 [Sylvanvirus sp.]|uniref:Uncharacterized protein n=1 Tax=Sylvanvirus sp. TaxID=2487774 RepID=A0A3G5AIU5_9VIRU|nr:MAG: hypothetical protein Sylvanvirus26_7 [Sylvanvirus sp.]
MQSHSGEGPASNVAAPKISPFDEIDPDAIFALVDAKVGLNSLEVDTEDPVSPKSSDVMIHSGSNSSSSVDGKQSCLEQDSKNISNPDSATSVIFSTEVAQDIAKLDETCNTHILAILL